MLSEHRKGENYLCSSAISLEWIELITRIYGAMEMLTSK
jgi:hypothetical protein